MSVAPPFDPLSLRLSSTSVEEVVAFVAHWAWQAAGCPDGRAVEVLREAEAQVRATHDLLLAELAVERVREVAR